jgi:hypothetical protein
MEICCESYHVQPAAPKLQRGVPNLMNENVSPPRDEEALEEPKTFRLSFSGRTFDAEDIDFIRSAIKIVADMVYEEAIIIDTQYSEAFENAFWLAVEILIDYLKIIGLPHGKPYIFRGSRR